MIMEKITKEEIEVIKQAKAGNMSAFNKLFYKYKSFVDNILYSYIKDEDEAKDIANVVFLKVFDKLSKFNDYSSFGGWLRILTKNTAVDYLRTIRTKNISLDTIDPKLQYPDLKKSDKSDVVDKLTCEYIVGLFDQFSPIHKKVCMMFYVDNMTVSQISKTLNISTNTIKSYLFRMRKRLQKQLKLT